MSFNKADKAALTPPLSSQNIIKSRTPSAQSAAAVAKNKSQDDSNINNNNNNNTNKHEETSKSESSSSSSSNIAKSLSSSPASNNENFLESPPPPQKHTESLLHQVSEQLTKSERNLEESEKLRREEKEESERLRREETAVLKKMIEDQTEREAANNLRFEKMFQMMEALKTQEISAKRESISAGYNIYTSDSTSSSSSSSEGVKNELSSSSMKNELPSSSPLKVTPLKAKIESLHDLQQKLKSFTLEKVKKEKLRKVDEIDSEEEKYEIHSKSAHYDSDEEKVRKREKKALRNEEETYDSESDDETHLNNYIHYLEKREEIFPYEKYRYKYYKTMYNLLSPLGRKFEWLRFGFLTGFPVSLYGRMINKWYNKKKEEVGLESKGMKNRRKVSDRVLQVPQMSFDPRDDRIKIRSDKEEDLYANPHVYENIPADLRCAPEQDAAEKMRYSSVEEYVKSMFSIKKLRKELLHQQQDLYSSSSSSSDSEDDLEHYECAICHVIVKNRPYSKICEKCDIKIKEEKIISSIPSLEKENIISENKRVLHETVQKMSEMNYSASSVLGKVIQVIFTADAVASMECLKMQHATHSEKQKAVKDMISTVGQFSGDTAKAPAWLHAYCRAVFRFSLEINDCLYVLTACFKSEAYAWLDQNMAKVTISAQESNNSKVNILEALLLMFKEQYMSFTQVNMWRKQLDGTKMTSENLSELKNHYRVYVDLFNNLRLCDNKLDLESVKYTYFFSLPKGVQQFIGAGYSDMKTIDSIYQVATQYLTMNKMNEKKVSDGSLAPRQVMVNSMYAQDTNNYYNNNNNYDEYENNYNEYEQIALNPLHAEPRRNPRNNNNRNRNTPQNPTPQDGGWEKQNLARMHCFHCGQKGHRVPECSFINRSQTSLGASAWAKFNEFRGTNKPYDKEIYTQNIKSLPSSSTAYVSSANANNSSSSSNNIPTSANRFARPLNTAQNGPLRQQQTNEAAKKKKKAEETVEVSDSEEDTDG